MATAKGQEPSLPPLWERLNDEIAWYDAKAAKAQRAYKRAKVTIIVLALALPVLAEYGEIPGFHDSRALLVAIAAGGILLFEGLQQLNKWQENWILYPSTCEHLRNERNLFFEKAGRLTPISSRKRRSGRWPNGWAC